MEGRPDDNVAQILSRYKLAAGGPNAAAGGRKDTCSRTTQLLLLEGLVVICILALIFGVGALHRPSSSGKSGHSTRYQRGRESSIRAFMLADKDGDGKLTSDEVRTLFADKAENGTKSNDGKNAEEGNKREQGDAAAGGGPPQAVRVSE